MTQPDSPRGEVKHTRGPLAGHVYRSREDGAFWSFVGLWQHPQHRDYHVNWGGKYAIVQVYGNFTNELRLIDLATWNDLFVLAWEPLKVCQFCGFSRMRPCLMRQTCASLTDYRLEPDEPDEVAKATGSTQDGAPSQIELINEPT